MMVNLVPGAGGTFVGIYFPDGSKVTLEDGAAVLRRDGKYVESADAVELLVSAYKGASTEPPRG